ncbi:MAG TPA: hypothetical protein VL047_00880 [Albibacterium sp.]|nr:hypothetical protein [Albibacterium sp.]
MENRYGQRKMPSSNGLTVIILACVYTMYDEIVDPGKKYIKRCNSYSRKWNKLCSMVINGGLFLCKSR